MAAYARERDEGLSLINIEFELNEMYRLKHINIRPIKQSLELKCSKVENLAKR